METLLQIQIDELTPNTNRAGKVNLDLQSYTERVETQAEELKNENWKMKCELDLLKEEIREKDKKIRELTDSLRNEIKSSQETNLHFTASVNKMEIALGLMNTQIGDILSELRQTDDLNISNADRLST